MDVDEALIEATKFQMEYPDGFGDTGKLIAAAILWGENKGELRVRRLALKALREAEKEIREFPLTKEI